MVLCTLQAQAAQLRYAIDKCTRGEKQRRMLPSCSTRPTDCQLQYIHSGISAFSSAIRGCARDNSHAARQSQAVGGAVSYLKTRTAIVVSIIGVRYVSTASCMPSLSRKARTNKWRYRRVRLYTSTEHRGRRRRIRPPQACYHTLNECTRYGGVTLPMPLTTSPPAPPVQLHRWDCRTRC